MKPVPEIDAEGWHKACYYAVREDHNNNLSGKKLPAPYLDKKMDKIIRSGIDVFLKFDKLPFACSIVEMDSIYNCMLRRGIVDPRDPSNQQRLKLKGFARRKERSACSTA